MRRTLALAAALAAALLITSLAFASAPKTGYYYAAFKSGGTTVGQFFAHVNGKSTVISFSGTCKSKDTPGTYNTYEADKHFSVKGSSFDYKGKVTFTSGATGKAKSELSGRFTNGGKKWKGKGSVKGCKDAQFKGKFIGKHPGG